MPTIAWTCSDGPLGAASADGLQSYQEILIAFLPNRQPKLAKTVVTQHIPMLDDNWLTLGHLRVVATNLAIEGYASESRAIWWSLFPDRGTVGVLWLPTDGDSLRQFFT